MLELFEHNRVAYEAAVEMLCETGKAAVVHPTGTGKSFIGFKLCEDYPDKRVLWLSPSEYIFKTQLENLKHEGGDVPQNVNFITYAKLMIAGDEEIETLNPDIIICDEFHRAGADRWQIGVENLIKQYPNVPMLGLSATAIRYLDSQRDMADELFDGNIASEMTLGEAIVRGVLNPPKYVLSVFSYQKDLEKYKNRVRRARNKVVRSAAERYLEALRRALDKADGLDVIFDRHMTDRTGKYIVFCANKEHMDEMMEKAGEWFYKVDPAPHIYSVYSEDPGASRSFADFKADRDYTHLRLLYCIDALNEGIHVEDVSGVILLRPTVSPIIYKQQIGRALSATVIIGACINFCLNMVLIHFFKSTGAAIASVAAETAIAVIQLIIVRKEISPWQVLREGVHYYVAGAVMMLALWPVTMYLSPSILHTAIIVVIGAAVYFAMLLIQRDEFFLSNASKVLAGLKRGRSDGQ